jgi:hypothetical protein
MPRVLPSFADEIVYTKPALGSCLRHFGVPFIDNSLKFGE